VLGAGALEFGDALFDERAPPIDPATGTGTTARQTLDDHPQEFPRVNDLFVARPHRYAVATHGRGLHGPKIARTVALPCLTQSGGDLIGGRDHGATDVLDVGILVDEDHGQGGAGTSVRTQHRGGD